MIERLVYVLRALAAPPDALRADFPGLMERSGEIAGDFSDAMRLVIDCPQIRLEPDQRDALDRVEEFLDGRRDVRHVAFWTEPELRSGPEWVALRGLAREALRQLRIPADPDAPAR